MPITKDISIIRGDDFLSPIFRHKDSLGAYIDTSTWVVSASIYTSNDYGAAKLIDFTVTHQPAPEYGYQLSLTELQTDTLVGASRFYDIETINGTTVKTYIDGTVTISGV